MSGYLLSVRLPETGSQVPYLVLCHRCPRAPEAVVEEWDDPVEPAEVMRAVAAHDARGCFDAAEDDPWLFEP